MGNASFLQSTFLGGVWSANIQGNMASQAYKTALNTSENYMPVEEGALTRRPGTRFLGPTRHGKAGRLMAFDFSIIQPYQLEFTDGYLRIYAGLALVTYAPVDIVDILPTNPAQIVTGSPHGMVTGNDAKFIINATPASVPDIAGRQVVITKIDNNNFTIADAVTGAAIDGSSYAYSTLHGTDQVAHIFQLPTQYNNGIWNTLRLLSNEDNVLFLHSGIKPYVMTEGVTPDPFQINAANFYDGPYLDINGTTTTLTPSGTSGSVTLTASATTGINGGNGFQTTDVGRLVRIQGGPPVWVSGTTYAKNDVVTGSDNNTYQSLIASNTGHDPTTDGGVNWALGVTGVTWTWAQITARSSATVVTATIKGPKLVNTDATPVWRLGLFSDTTGWPTTGAYHEGRLWLTGVIGNRIDGGTANNIDVITGIAMPVGTYNFAPTAPDGTVADNCGIAAIANAIDVNAIFWMESDSEGLLLGTQAGEWLVKASQLDDPLTPTSIQMRRFSTYGVANIEPVRANRELIFVQRQQRKVLELGYYPYGEVAGYYAPNMAKFAENLTAEGIAEIRWQQDQIPVVWMRRNDGTLLGVTYKHAPASGMGTADTFTAWHGPHFLGHERAVESISTGPSYDGLSQSLYMVSNQTDDGSPNFNVRWVEVLTPIFDDAQADWATYFVDGGVNPATAVEQLISNGAAFNGVTIYGLHYLDGSQISVVIGALDLGDYTVTGGKVDLVFGAPAAFTQTFFEAFGTGAINYGVFDTAYSFTVTSAGTTPPFSANSFGSYVNASETHGNFTYADIDLKNGTLYGVNTQDSFFDRFTYSNWTLLTSTAFSSFSPTYGFDSAAFISNDDEHLVYYSGHISSQHYVVQKHPTSPFTEVAVETTGEGGDAPDARQFLPIHTLGGSNWLGVVGVTSVSQEQAVTILNTDDMVWGMTNNVTEDSASMFPGPNTHSGYFYAMGKRSTYSSGDSVGLYAIDIGGGAFISLGKIAPADIDATWTTFSVVTTPVFDAKDGNIMFGAHVTDSVTHPTRFLKINPNTLDIVWNTPVNVISEPSDTQRKTRITTQHYGYFGGEDGVYFYDTTNGTETLKTFSTIFDALGPSYFDPIDGGVVVFDAEASWSGSPTPLGPYSTVHETTSIAAGRTTKVYFGVNTEATTATTVFHAPTSAGFTYTSKGQLLRPDFGPDAGAQQGPSFGKKRRIHSATWGLYRTQQISVGTDPNDLKPLKLQTDGGSAIDAPNLYSGITWDSINDDYGFTSQLAWEQTRPYPALIQAIEGYIAAQDK